MSCPLCGSEKFYIKDPEDAFSCYAFDYINGEVCMDPEESDEAPALEADTETYCDTCAWHGKFKALG